ncbi:MAG TPA: histone H1 [Candidatus Limnocylindria bacterium]|nr:histone H1 [Candidatus Limnocylindria bacterium]
MKKRKMPRDPNQLAKMIVDMTLHEDEPESPERVKDPASVELGRQGGLIGGPRRAAKLSPERRSEIARKAAAARWGKQA